MYYQVVTSFATSDYGRFLRLFKEAGGPGKESPSIVKGCPSMVRDILSTDSKDFLLL